jgi:sugar/nucleoside kinase (ribokinase family)
MNLLSRASHMHFSSCFLQPGIRHDLARLFRQAKVMGLTTSFDPQWDPSEKWEIPLEQLLPNVDVFLPNAQEFMLLTRCRSVNEGIQKLRSYAHCIVIKNGSEGALAWDGTHPIVQPDCEQVVDCGC